MKLWRTLLGAAAVLALLVGVSFAQTNPTPVPQCVSGPIQIDAHRSVVYTPDCNDRTKAVGTEAYANWFKGNLDRIGGVYVSIYTLNNQDVVAAWMAANQLNIPVHVAVDYNELQAVGAGTDKAIAAGKTTDKKSEHMIANDMCSANMDVLWGTSPANNHDIMHMKSTVLVDKQGKPFAVSYGSWNYSTRADFEANEMHFVEDDVEAMHAFNQWMLIHDAMVRQNKPFYSPPKDGVDPGNRTTTCPELSTKTTYGAADAATPAPAKDHTRRPRKS